MAQYTDIIIDQGSSYSGKIPVIGFNNLPVNLNGFLARGQIRKSYSSLTAVDFTAVVDNNPSTGIVYVSLTPQQTAEMKPGRYVFDVEIYNSNTSEVIRISEGQATVTPRVTKDTV